MSAALRWFVKAFEFDPLDYENWAHMASDLDSIGDSETADRYIERAAEIGPGEPAVLKCTVLIELHRGNIDTATSIAREALAADLGMVAGDVITLVVQDEGHGIAPDALVPLLLYW